MPRRLRNFDPECIYHVGSRSVDKQRIFNGCVPNDDGYFVTLLAQVVRAFGLELYAYCLIWNHFHLIARAPLDNYSAAMQVLKSEYACWFNYLVGREGALWERRFWDRVGNDQETTAEQVRYVVLNPVRAGVVAHPDQWESSSYRATVGLAEAPAFLDVVGARELVGGEGCTPARFAEFVNAGLPLAVSESVLLGSDPDKTLEVPAAST